MDNVGMLHVMRLDLTQAEPARTPRLIRQSDPALCKIDVQLSGRSYVEQGDRQAALARGTFSFVDLSRPHRIAANRARVATAWFPRALLPLVLDRLPAMVRGMRRRRHDDTVHSPVESVPTVDRRDPFLN